MLYKYGLVEKQPAATSTNGVVGQTGRNKPIAPSVKNKNPSPSKINFFICYLLVLFAALLASALI